MLLTGEEVAIKVQRPNIGPIIKQDLCIFRACAALVDPVARRRLGASAGLIVDEFGPGMRFGRERWGKGQWPGVPKRV